MTDNLSAPMPTDPRDREMVEEVERDIRVAIWNAGMNGGMGQELTQAFIRRAMDEPCMKRALAAFATPTAPAPGDAEPSAAGASAPGEAQPAQWAVEAERAAAEAYAQNMGDPDGKDETSAARRDAALAIEQHALAALRPSPQDERVARLEEALRPFAACADELDGSEDVPRAPDGEWAKFRLLTDDYRRARAALSSDQGGETQHG